MLSFPKISGRGLIKLLVIISVVVFFGCAESGQPEPSVLGYSDGRPVAQHRFPVNDLGIVLRYGDAPDGCDVAGAREANINRENDQFYLFYDGQGKDGWKTCLAISSDLKNWIKKGTVLQPGVPGSKDAGSASSPWVIHSNDGWQMFYLGTSNVTSDGNLVPMFPYFTMKARALQLAGPWEKQYDVTPFTPKDGTYYATTASPGYILKNGEEYLQFFSASAELNGKIKRTLGIARTRDLDGTWTIDAEPILPPEEQVENSSIYFQQSNQTWYLFTNHVGVDQSGFEYTDAVWVYWSRDLNKWSAEDKAVVIDATASTWAKGAIGMPSVIEWGDRLAILYDGVDGLGRGHMKRNIGLATLQLPLLELNI
jgi:predicted GH43/DUF377 family glycosyl hydrolase